MKNFLKSILLSLVVCNIAIASPSPTTYTEEQTTIQVTAEQPEFVIKLKSNPTTGYSWYLNRYQARLIQPVKHQFIPGDKKLIGAPGFESWTFRIKPHVFNIPQQTKIRFSYVRPWEKNTEKAKTLTFKVFVSGG